MKLWAVIVLTFIPLASFCQTEDDCPYYDRKYEIHLSDSTVLASCDNSVTDTVVLDSFPAFPGGYTSFVKFLDEKKYPDSFYISGEVRKVYLQFCVERNGWVTMVRLYPGTEEMSPLDFNKEAIRLMHSSPNWKPGYMNGQPVPVQIVVLLMFEVDEPRKWKRILKKNRKRLIQKG